MSCLSTVQFGNTLIEWFGQMLHQCRPAWRGQILPSCVVTGKGRTRTFGPSWKPEWWHKPGTSGQAFQPNKAGCPGDKHPGNLATQHQSDEHVCKRINWKVRLLLGGGYGNEIIFQTLKSNFRSKLLTIATKLLI